MAKNNNNVYVVAFEGRGHNENFFEIRGIYPSLKEARANSSFNLDIYRAPWGAPRKKWIGLGAGG